MVGPQIQLPGSEFFLKVINSNLSERGWYICLAIRTDTKAFDQDWVQNLRKGPYEKPIAEFKGILEEIGGLQGWDLDDLKNTFSNPLLDELIFGE